MMESWLLTTSSDGKVAKGKKEDIEGTGNGDREESLAASCKGEEQECHHGTLTPMPSSQRLPSAIVIWLGVDFQLQFEEDTNIQVITTPLQAYELQYP